MSSLLLTTSLCAHPVSRDSLRIPTGQENTLKRMEALQKQAGPEEAIASGENNVATCLEEIKSSEKHAKLMIGQDVQLAPRAREELAYEMAMGINIYDGTKIAKIFQNQINLLNELKRNLYEPTNIHKEAWLEAEEMLFPYLRERGYSFIIPLILCVYPLRNPCCFSIFAEPTIAIPADEKNKKILVSQILAESIHANAYDFPNKFLREGFEQYFGIKIRLLNEGYEEKNLSKNIFLEYQQKWFNALIKAGYSNLDSLLYRYSLRTVLELINKIGEKPLEHAYWTGDRTLLEEKCNILLGKDAWQEIVADGIYCSHELGTVNGALNFYLSVTDRMKGENVDITQYENDYWDGKLGSIKKERDTDKQQELDRELGWIKSQEEAFIGEFDTVKAVWKKVTYLYDKRYRHAIDYIVCLSLEQSSKNSLGKQYNIDDSYYAKKEVPGVASSMERAEFDENIFLSVENPHPQLLAATQNCPPGTKFKLFVDNFKEFRQGNSIFKDIGVAKIIIIPPDSHVPEKAKSPLDDQLNSSRVQSKDI